MIRGYLRSPAPALLVLGLVALAMVSVALVATASNSVPVTMAGSSTNAVTVAELAPSGCNNAASLTAVVLGPNSSGATVPGTSANELILAGASSQTLGLDTGGGSDCCVGTNDNTTIFKASCTYALDK